MQHVKTTIGSQAQVERQRLVASFPGLHTIQSVIKLDGRKPWEQGNVAFLKLERLCEC